MTTETDIIALKDQVSALLLDVNRQKASLASSVAASSLRQAVATANTSLLATVNTDVTAVATAAATDATSTTTAKNLALTAWASAVSPVESYASSLQGLHAGVTLKSIIYDTSKDSDGGAWRKKCQDKSWYNETLGGTKWLGQKSSAALAWATSGAASGHYFQNSTDTKFYQLGSVSPNVTEVFRGNVREFPAVVAIVSQDSRLIIYDLTQPNCPMWMVFLQSYVGSQLGILGNYGSAGSLSCAAVNGNLCVGSEAQYGYVAIVSFPSDLGKRYRSLSSSNGSEGYWRHGIARRNDQTVTWSTVVMGMALPALVAENTNSIAATVLPDAPIDSATGLPIPTVFAGTIAGVSRIAHDGTVSSDPVYSRYTSVRLFGEWLYIYDNVSCWKTSTGVALTPSTTSGNYTSYRSLTYSPSQSLSCPIEFYSYGAKEPIKANSMALSSSKGFNLVRDGASYSLRTRSLVAAITNTYNSGWQAGDSRLSALADTVAETISSAEIAGASFSTTTGWVGTTGSVTANATPYTTCQNVGYLGLVANKTYQITYTVAITSGNVSLQFFGSSAQNTNQLSTSGTYSQYFTPSEGKNACQPQAGGNGFVGTISALSIKPADPDRSCKKSGLIVSGSLTKTAVATAAQLVAYSGWSSSNYLTQPYLSNLDFGTSEWDVGAWFNTSASAASITETIIAAGGLGTELIVNGSLGSGITGWLSSGSGSVVSAASGTLDVSATTVTNGVGSTNPFAMTPKMYRLSFNVVAITGSWQGGITKNYAWDGISYVSNISTTGLKTVTYASTSSASENRFLLWALTDSATISVDNISVREVTGILPILERSSLRNLLTYSGDFSNAGWLLTSSATKIGWFTSQDGGNTAYKITYGVDTSGIYKPGTSIAGTPTTVAVWLRGDSSGTVKIANANGGTSQVVNVTTSWQLFAVNFNAVGTSDGIYIYNTTGTGGQLSSWYVSSAALFQGTYTAAQILANGGIPLTTATVTPAGPSFSLGIDASAKLRGTAFDGTTTRTVTSPNAINIGSQTLAGVSYRTNGNLELTVNDAVVATASGAALATLSNAAGVLTVGNDLTHLSPFPGSLTLLTVSGTVPSSSQRSHIYSTELAMMQPNVKCTIDGTSPAVTALAYDESTDLLHVGTSWGRSAFKDLVRVESEATISGPLVALSANRGTVVSSGTSVNIYKPAFQFREELKRKDEVQRVLGQLPVYFEFDATTGQTAFVVPSGYAAKAVYAAGSLKRQGLTKDYTISNDGFQETVNFGTAPGNAVFVSIMATRSN